MTLRVLDLGCHDGYVGAHLADQHQGPLELYGVELHAEAAEIARRRGYRQVQQGNALNAPTLFPDLIGACDAVIAYEILEHVLDPRALLSSAERMLKPGGRVYVSTPDGTFGDGGNPNHLRALRSIDLALLLRERGRIEDMHVGPDGITAAAYTPAPRLGEIAVYTGPGWMTWHPNDINAHGLGGSETAAVYLADELDQIGYQVTVYGDVEQGLFRNVAYRHHSCFDPLEPRTAVISSRTPEIFDRPVNAERTLLWMHDTDYGPRLTPERAKRIDHVLTLSAWHRRHVHGTYPFLGGKIKQVRNGINLDRFTGPAGAREPRVLYTSSPDRGLDVLLELWPAVREACQEHDLEPVLHACYSPVYWRIADQDPVVGAHAARVRELARQPGVTLGEALGQRDLARLMRESLVWVAPSYNTPHQTPFHETSCIGAMEAQAAGCHVVASNWGALSETVKVGHKIDGPPMSDQWKRALVTAIVDGLTNPRLQRFAQARGPVEARDMAWAPVARRVARLIG